MEQIKDFCKEKYPFIIVFIWAFVASFIGNVFVLFVTEVVLFAFALICGAKMQFDIGDILLGLGMFFFYFFDGRSFVMSVVLAGEVLIVYQIGKWIASNQRINDYSQIKHDLLILTGVFFAYGLVDYINIILRQNLATDCFRYPLGSILVPKTQHEFWFVMSSALLAWFFFFSNGMNKKTKMKIIILGITGIVLTVYVKGRINFSIFVIGLCISVLCVLFNKIKSVKQGLFWLVGIIFVIGGLMRLLFIFDIFRVKDIYANSFWSRNGGILNNVRFEMWKAGLDLLIKHPFGGNHIEDVQGYWWTFHYAHNTWIDIGVVSGVIPFVLLLIFTGYVTWRLFCAVRHSYLDDICIVMYAYIGVFLYNMIEPAIIANRVFWSTLVLLSGIIIGIGKRKSR